MTYLPSTLDELEELAKSGGIALAGAMATEAFRAARAGVARLFGRLGSKKQETAVTQFDEDADLVADAEDPEHGEVRDELARVWRRRLTRLLKDDSDAYEDLRNLITQIQAALPEAQQQWVQTNIALDNAAVYAAQGGNVIHHQALGKQVPSVPSNASGQPEQPR